MRRQDFANRVASGLLAALVVAGCGGGGTGDGTLATAGGIDRSGATVGTITGFSSIIVNGVEYETGAAMILDDDSADARSLTEDDLDVGDVVRIEGSRDDDGITGTADRVIFEAEVEGPIDSLAVAAEEMVVLGRTVRVDADTIFDDAISPASLDGLAVGDIVEVSGFAAADDAVLATRIELEPSDTTEFEVKGRVADLDGGNRTFRLGSRTVDFGMAELEDFDGASVAEGDLVEVEGTLDAGGVLVATEVELESERPLDGDDGLDEGDEAEIEGLITRFASASDFDVARQPVTTDASTEFENGDAADLAVDLKVEVEGELDGDGVLVATEVSIRLEVNAEIEGLVSNIDDAAGTLEVNGIPVRIVDSTLLENDLDGGDRRLSITLLNPNDFVEVEGTIGDDGVLVARRLELDEGDDVDDADDDPDVNELEFEGELTSIDDAGIELLGQRMAFNVDTEFEIADVTVSKTEFLAQVTAGTRVDVDAVRNDQLDLVVREIELDTDD